MRNEPSFLLVLLTLQSKTICTEQDTTTRLEKLTWPNVLFACARHCDCAASCYPRAKPGQSAESV